MEIKLSDHFSYFRLLRFAVPSIIMLIFTSLYTVVDGFFVSNFVGKDSFTAVNFSMPLLLMLGSLGIVFGSGGGALIAKTLGEGHGEKARRLFSLIIYTSVGCGVLLAALGLYFLRPLATALGAQGQLLENSVVYGRIILAALPAYVLQYEFQCLFPVAEKPTLGLYVTIAAGLANILLDALFIIGFDWGLEGAAWATAASQTVGGLLPLLYFALPNSSLLRLGSAAFDLRALLKVCSNGVSELMSNIAMSVVGMLYNWQLLRYAGEDGVAVYGVLMYVSFVFSSAFIGYSFGVAPLIGYNYGARRHEELKSLLRKSLVVISCFAVAMFTAAFTLSRQVAQIFVGYDADLLQLAVHAFAIFAFCFLFSGYAIFASSFFTALNNGFISATISFMRTLVFEVAAVLILPLWFGLDGIWFSCVAAEVMAATLTVFFLRLKRRHYQY
ncbi:MAG: MATE family efflux transporter [Phascolarctobacterium sp.]|uniref:MATE family efflux transporter n=1 Tax=Phascolarctobacterium sp. TaxID=2049039 RepID=UPI0026DB3882|nr:MATE family efflux transporter [Phascolarctobacterium sp.]MDO4920651.1 MATE family efflux transporter [Phascolarctobacterium sp.]